MATTLVWSTFADATCSGFNIYRAITGIKVTFPNSLQIGDQFIFASSSGAKQVVTMSGTTTTSLVSDVNANANGLEAVLSTDTASVFIRVTAKKNPRFQLFPCSFATDVSQTPRIILPRMEFVLVANKPRVANAFDYQYIDTDGNAQDWYHMTTVTAGLESLPSLDAQGLITPEKFCSIVGRVVNPQNRSAIQARITVKIYPTVQSTDNSGILQEEFSVETDIYGRFSIPVLQHKTILLSIPAIGYNQVVIVPEQSYVLYQYLIPVNDQLFYQDQSALCPPSGP